MKEAYISEITKMLNAVDLELLDLIFQILNKTIQSGTNPSEEDLPSA